MSISQSGELTESERRNIRNEIDKILAKSLRDVKVFTPLTLMLMNYEIRIVDRCLPGLDAPAWTDYKSIWINVKSEFFQTCQKASMKFEQILASLMFHEVMHPMLYHDKRRGHRDPELWNIAADFVLNLLLANLEVESAKHVKNKLVDLNIRAVPSDKICLDDGFAGMVEEEVYTQLLKSQTNKTTYYMSLQDFMDSIGDPGDQDGEQNDGKNGKNGKGNDGKDSKDPKGQGNKPKMSKDPNEVDGPQVKITQTEINHKGKKIKITNVEMPQPSTGDKEQEEKDQKRRERNVQMNRKMFEDTLMAGVESEALKLFLGKLFKVKIDFEKILKDSLMTALQKGTDQVWHKPRKIWLANPGIPYLPSEDDEEVRGIAFFAIDESGSMSNDDIRKAISIVNEANTHYKKLVIIKHDHEVAKEGIFEFDEENKLTDDMIEKLLVRVRCGGTSHKDVFKYINNYLKKHPDDMASVFVGCTDLMSDLESCQNDLPSYIPRIWISNCDYRVEGLIGRVIRLQN